MADLENKDVDNNVKSFLNMAEKSTDPVNDALRTTNGKKFSVSSDVYGNSATPEYKEAHDTENSLNNQQFNDAVNSGKVIPKYADSLQNSITAVQGDNNDYNYLTPRYRESMAQNMPKPGTLEYMKVRAFNDILRSGKLPSADTFRPKDIGIDPKSINSKEKEKLDTLIGSLKDGDYDTYNEMEKQLDISDKDKLNDNNTNKGNEYDILKKIDDKYGENNESNNETNTETNNESENETNLDSDFDSFANETQKDFDDKFLPTDMVPKEQVEDPLWGGERSNYANENIDNLYNMANSENPDWKKINELAVDMIDNMGYDKDSYYVVEKLDESNPDYQDFVREKGFAPQEPMKKYQKDLNNLLKSIPREYLTTKEPNWPKVYRNASSFGKILNNVLSQTGKENKSPTIDFSNIKNEKGDKLFLGTGNKARKILTRMAKKLRPRLSNETMSAYDKLASMDNANVWTELSEADLEDLSNVTPEQMSKLSPDAQHYVDTYAKIRKEEDAYDKEQIKEITEEAKKVNPEITSDDVANEYYPALLEEEDDFTKAYAVDENGNKIESRVEDEEPTSDIQEQPGESNYEENTAAPSTGNSKGFSGGGNIGRKPLRDFVNHLRSNGKSASKQMKEKLKNYFNNDNNMKFNSKQAVTENKNIPNKPSELSLTDEPSRNFYSGATKGTTGSISFSRSNPTVSSSGVSYKDTKIPNFNTANKQAGGETLKDKNKVSFNMGADLLNFSNLANKSTKLRLENSKRKPLKGEFPVLSEVVANDTHDIKRSKSLGKPIIKGGLYTSSDAKYNNDLYSKIIDIIVNSYKDWDFSDGKYILEIPSLNSSIIYDGVSQPKISTKISYSYSGKATVNISTLLRKPDGEKIINSIYEYLTKENKK